MRTRRFRPPSITTLLVTLAAIVGVIAAGAVVAAGYFAGVVVDESRKVKGESRETRVLLNETNANRVLVLELACREVERVKADVRDVLTRFDVDRADLPRASDGRRAFDPVPYGDCRKYAEELVAPPPAP